MSFIGIDPGYKRLGLVVFNDTVPRTVVYSRTFDLSRTSTSSPSSCIGANDVVFSWYEAWRPELHRFFESDGPTITIVIEENGAKCHRSSNIATALVSFFRYKISPRAAYWSVYPRTIYNRMVKELGYRPPDIDANQRYSRRKFKKEWTMHWALHQDDFDLAPEVRENLDYDQADAILNTFLCFKRRI